MTGAFSPNARITKHAVWSKKGVVAAQNTKAARAGADVLAAGGNAMDAAIATSFALGAVEPWMSGLAVAARWFTMMPPKAGMVQSTSI